MQMDRRAFTLQPLIAQGILHPGDNRLSCAVGGIDYYAGKMPEINIPCNDTSKALVVHFRVSHSTYALQCLCYADQSLYGKAHFLWPSPP